MPHVCWIYHLAEVPFVLDSAERLGLDLTMLMRPGETPPPALPCIRRVLTHDVHADEAGGLERLAAIHDSDRFDGLACIREIALPFAARAARALGLPFLDAAVVARCRDKGAMRACLAAHGVNHPRFVRLPLGAPVPETAEALRYPLIVKPAAGVSSAGVRRADDRAGLLRAVREAEAVVAERAYMTETLAGARPGLVVEEYIDGHEYVCETFSQAGRVAVLGIGYKGYPTGPFFEETVYRIPSGLPPAIEAHVADQAVRAVRALGITDGPAHTELRVTADGVAFVIETGARIGGGGVSHYMVQLATGVDMAALVFGLALRRDPGPLPKLPPVRPVPAGPRGAVAMFLVPAGAGGIVERIDNLDRVAAEPAVIRVLQFVQPGTAFRGLPFFDGYPAVIFSRHPDIAACDAFHARLAGAVRVIYRD